MKECLKEILQEDVVLRRAVIGALVESSMSSGENNQINETGRAFSRGGSPTSHLKNVDPNYKPPKRANARQRQPQPQQQITFDMGDSIMNDMLADTLNNPNSMAIINQNNIESTIPMQPDASVYGDEMTKKVSRSTPEELFDTTNWSTIAFDQ